MMRVLSRDPDNSIFGFSSDVAREVTHPLWPVRVPFKMSCSVMLEDEVDESCLVAKFLRFSSCRGLA